MGDFRSSIKPEETIGFNRLFEADAVYRGVIAGLAWIETSVRINRRFENCLYKVVEGCPVTLFSEMPLDKVVNAIEVFFRNVAYRVVEAVEGFIRYSSYKVVETVEGLFRILRK